MARSEYPREHTIKLFDWKILTYIAIGPGSERSVHLRFIVAHARENNDGQIRVDFADKGNERDAIDLGHLKIDNGYFAVVLRKPVSSLKSVGERLAGVTFLAEIGDKKAGDGGVIIDDEELRGITSR